MHDLDLTPEERRIEVARLLALGMLRWQQHAAGTSLESSAESVGSGLEFLAETVLSVPTG